MVKRFDYLVTSVALFMILVYDFQRSLAQTQSRIKLPPVPNAEINNESILGIDSNKNNVRDDVESYIYNNLKKKDPVLFRAYLKYAETITMILVKKNNEKDLAHLYDQRTSDGRCVESLEKDSIDDLIKVINNITNTTLRKEAMNTAGTNTKKYSSPNVPKEKWKLLCR